MFDQILRQCLTSLGCAALSLGVAQAQTTSPFQPPKEKLGTYVINTGPGLDTGCTFRGGGPLLIRLTVPKVVNDTQLNADGTLKNAAQLVRDKVLSAQATIRFPVFDIDDKAGVSGYAPEVDRVTFNGRFKKVLAGFNNTWTDDSIVVPIEELKWHKRWRDGRANTRADWTFCCARVSKPRRCFIALPNWHRECRRRCCCRCWRTSRGVQTRAVCASSFRRVRWPRSSR